MAASVSRSEASVASVYYTPRDADPEPSRSASVSDSRSASQSAAGVSQLHTAGERDSERVTKDDVVGAVAANAARSAAQTPPRRKTAAAAREGEMEGAAGELATTGASASKAVPSVPIDSASWQRSTLLASPPPASSSSGARAAAAAAPVGESNNLAAADFLSEFHRCCRHNRVSELSSYLSSRQMSSVDMRDAHGNTALIIACQNGHKKIVKALLRAGADVNARNLKGNTALHYLYAFNYNELATYLLQRGADAHAKNQLGLVPAQGIAPAGG
jgi:hypothetical protein